MTDFLLDSTVHMHWSKSVASVVDWLAATSDQPGDRMMTSTVSIAEVATGAAPETETNWAEYFDRLSIIDVNRNIAVLAGQLRFRLARSGKQLHLADALIAATAILHQMTVVTENVKDFEIAGVDVLPLGPASH